MSETSHYLGLPYLMPSQAQKHVTHNEALRQLDALVQISVTSIGLNEPPQTAIDGERYVIGASASGEWAGHSGKLAALVDGAWYFFVPAEGWIVWDASDRSLMIFDGTDWTALQAGSGGSEGATGADQFGINAAASQSQRLVVRSDGVLFDHEQEDVRAVINKAGENSVASLIFQSGYQGRAEVGLVGNDALSLRVSADGSNWIEAMSVEQNSGSVRFPAAGVEISGGLFPNLLPDSGRFTPAGNQHRLTESAFQLPGYLSPFNNATISFPHQFIHNNNNYGGSRGALASAVDDLVSLIAGEEEPRYGPEFWLMQIDAGSGSSSSFSIDGETYYRQTIVDANPRPAKFTTGFFIRAISGKCALRPQSSIVNDLRRDGNPAEYGTSSVVIEPADGWVYFESQSRRTTLSYEQNDMSISMKSGSSAYFALPRVLAGHVTIGKGIGIVPNDRLFEA